MVQNLKNLKDNLLEFLDEYAIFDNLSEFDRKEFKKELNQILKEHITGKKLRIKAITKKDQVLNKIDSILIKFGTDKKGLEILEIPKIKNKFENLIESLNDLLDEIEDYKRRKNFQFRVLKE